MVKNILFNPLSPKKIAKLLFLFLSVFFLFHTVVWFLFTKQILDTPLDTRVGDLARLSYQLDSMQLRETSKLTLPQQHIEAKDWKEGPVDIITIGDSFSNGGAGGINPYYQDYLASTYHLKVLNLAPSKMDKNPIETIISLYNNGLLDVLKPRFILLSSVERETLKRFAVNISYDYNISQAQSLYNFKHPIVNAHKQKGISIINNGNYKVLINPLIYKFSNKPIALSGIYKMPLKRALFTAKVPDTLLFHQDDIKGIGYATEKNLQQLNHNLNTLARVLKEKNIRLIFMPAVDKYTLYAPYLRNNPFPQSHFFEDLNVLKKEYIFINTKQILSKLLPDQKDLYYADDTHWNFMASKTVVQSIKSMMQ